MADIDKAGLRQRRMTERPLSEMSNSLDATLPDGISSEGDSDLSDDQPEVNLTNGNCSSSDSESSIDMPGPGTTAPPNTPEPPASGRDYVEVIDDTTKLRTLTWVEPKTPYSSGVTITDAEPEKISLKVLVNELLRSAGFVGTLTYLGTLLGQAKSSGPLSVAMLFAVGQLSENSESSGIDVIYD